MTGNQLGGDILSTYSVAAETRGPEQTESCSTESMHHWECDARVPGINCKVAQGHALSYIPPLLTQEMADSLETSGVLYSQIHHWQTVVLRKFIKWGDKVRQLLGLGRESN